MYDQGTPMTEPATGRDYPPQEAITEAGYHRVPEPMERLHKKPLTKQQLLQEWPIQIKFLAKGCVVSVGCKDIAFSTIEEAMKAINDYVNDPKNAGNYWRGQFNM